MLQFPALGLQLRCMESSEPLEGMENGWNSCADGKDGSDLKEDAQRRMSQAQILTTSYILDPNFALFNKRKPNGPLLFRYQFRTG